MHKNYFTSGRWKDLFAFSRRERRGFAVLLAILAIECAALYFLHYTAGSRHTPTDFSSFEKDAEEFYASQQKREQPSRNLAATESKPPEKAPSRLFLFDPNELTREQGLQLGLSARMVSTILNYKKKGGQFRVKKDLKKIYGLTEVEYARLEPWVDLPDAPEKQTFASHVEKEIKPEKKEIPKIDIGIADTLELTRIHGVGVVFARRIDIYRNKLGGFFSIGQLREIYGMNDSLFEAIVPQIYIADTSNIRKIRINTADYTTLRNHPYIGRDLAGIISNYRKQHGVFKNSDDVRKMSLVTDELYRKLAPYLSME